jgi:hypothetical protein
MSDNGSDEERRRTSAADPAPVIAGQATTFGRIPHRQRGWPWLTNSVGGWARRQSAGAVTRGRRERPRVELDRSGAGRRNLLLASLPAKDFALLDPHLKDIVLEHGAVLQEQGDRIDQVYFPHEGIISLLTVTRQGDAIETAMIGCEGAVGAFAGCGPRRAHARAVVK